MINPNFLTDELADKIAMEIYKLKIKETAAFAFKQKIINLITTIKEKDDHQIRDATFDALFKAINPYEKKFETMLKRIWDEEKRILVANLKKMKKAWLQKDKIDDIMYPVAVFEKKLANGANGIFVEIMTAEGPRVVSLYDFDIIFDVDSPEIQKWLKSYTPKFGKSLEEVNIKKLRAELIEGMNAGEGVPELLRRVYETYDDWGFRRAKRIARTESLRAANKAALNVYRQSGVVKKKIWVTYHDPRTCFPRNVKIITDKGERKIINIRKGDIVLTHNGWQKVKETMNRKYIGTLIKIKMSNRRKLVMTEDHPVYEINKGWIEAKELIIGSKLKTCENKIVNIISIQNIKFFNSYYSISKFFKFFISSNVFQWVRMPIFAINLKANINHWKEKIHATFFNFFNLIFLNKINSKLFKCLSNCFLYRSFARMFSITRERTKSSCVLLIRLNSKILSTVQTFDIDRRTSTFFRAMFSTFSSSPENLSTFQTNFINCKFSLTDNTAKSISLAHRFINNKRLFTTNANFCNFFYSFNFPSTFSRTVSFIFSSFMNVKRFITCPTGFCYSCFSKFMIAFSRAKKWIVRFLNLIFRNKLFTTILTYIHDLYKYITISININQPNIVYNLEVKNTHTYYANGILVHNCPHCERLDGTIISLETNFFDLGDSSTVKIDGKDQTLKFDYEEIEAPPAHTQCRCAVSAYIED